VPHAANKKHYIYVLQSQLDSGLYIGYSGNLRGRLREHKQGMSFATSFRGPWKLIDYEAYLDEGDALGRERFLKSGSGRRLIRKQLHHYLTQNPVREAA
jgi:putative endonuclease